ncbi:MAG: FAD-dependent oxidoreductase [Rubrivivax sp.]|nr:FAD-dependent oxidoreductase [Rubrivivax sp.]
MNTQHLRLKQGSGAALSRRQWMRTTGLAMLAWPLAGLSDDNTSSSPAQFALEDTGLQARIVVVGGGMAGATVAKYLRLWGGSGVQVTLVEPTTQYTSHIMSNLVLGGSRNLASLAYGHGTLAARYGVQLRQAAVSAIDTAGQAVLLSDGGRLAYDRLVLAPGIDFDAAWGLSRADYDTRTPHAWRAGPQTELLRTQIAAMPADGLYVLAIPKAPYRCPPGPYERACLVADHLKATRGPAARVLVLDENAGIQAEPETFAHAFAVTHANTIDYRSGVTGLNFDPVQRQVQWADDLGLVSQRQAAVLNPIPPQRAVGSEPGGWLAAAGLANGTQGRWAKVNVLSYESTAVPRVHVIGDAAECGLPKAGHVANQEAKICADAIVRALSGQAPDPAPVANSACYSPITATTASWLSTVYQYDPARGGMRPAADNGRLDTGRAIESDSVSSRNFQDMNTWFTTLMGDSFA